MKQTTLLILVRRDVDQKISELCLAMKKRGFGMGRYNGVGGKCEPGESVIDATIREAHEEISVTVQPDHLQQVAILDFQFLEQPDWNQQVHVFLADQWQGDITESEEMNPKWFPLDAIPYDTMWPDDSYWLPQVIAGNRVRAEFDFLPGDVVARHDVQVVDSLQ